MGRYISWVSVVSVMGCYKYMGRYNQVGRYYSAPTVYICHTKNSSNKKGYVGMGVVTGDVGRSHNLRYCFLSSAKIIDNSF